PVVRADAAFVAALHQSYRGAVDRQTLAELGLVLPLQVIGGFENDQGKGLTTHYPPEDGFDAGAHYPGALVDVGWRAALPTPSGHIDRAIQVMPNRWSVAYAASGFAVPAAGDYELRGFTSDPLRVWVDGAEVFRLDEVKDRDLDQLAIPLHLAA